MLPYSRVLPSLLAVLALPPTTLAAQSLGEPAPSPPKRVVISGVVDVPMLDSGAPGASLPVIAVMVNGRGPFRFGVETGAGFIAVSREFVDALGLKRSGGTDEFPEYPVDSITFGGAAFRDLRVASIPRNARGVDGLLGLPFFHDVTFTIDYPANRFRVSRDTLPVANGKDILSLTHVGPFWGLPVELAGHAFTAVLDTRSMTGMSITPTGAAPLPFDGELRVVGRSGGAGLPTAELREGSLKGSAKIGAYTFPSPPISLRELPPGFPEGPLVGSRVLRNFVVSLDQRRQRLRLTREGSSTINLESVRAGMTPGAGVPTATKPNEATNLSEYAGTYGDRTLTMVDGKLTIQRPGGRQLELVVVGRDASSIVGIPAAKIEFGRDSAGKIYEIRVLNQQNQWESARRDSVQKR